MTGPQPQLLLGAQHPCSYLDGRTARSVFVDPAMRLDAARYGALLELGFRRSGAYVYRPACAGCHECRPARVPVARFRPDRGQRRCLRRNADLAVAIDTRLSDEHYALYRRYLQGRHPAGGMDPEDREAFHSFLSNRWHGAEILALRDHRGRLLAGGVMDRTPQGISAVYTYFDPDETRRGLGTYVVLKEIERATAMGVPYLYLGYWVPGSPTMDYKRRFQPLELLEGSCWRTVDSP